MLVDQDLAGVGQPGSEEPSRVLVVEREQLDELNDNIKALRAEMRARFDEADRERTSMWRGLLAGIGELSSMFHRRLPEPSSGAHTHTLAHQVRTCVPGRAAAMSTTNMERAGRRPVTEDVLMRLFEELARR